MKLYKNKFRVETARLKDWDYSTSGWYYITVCTKDKTNWFGEIKSGKMILNNLGKIVEDTWNVMPNHIHGIIIINSVETGHAPSVQPAKHTLGNVIGSFKSAVSKVIRNIENKNFQWQPRFYDHIIRNENDLRRIRKYIELNPLRWELDEYYSNS